jgi:transposase
MFGLPQPPEGFVCPYRHNCPHLEGLPAEWMWEQRQAKVGTECRYEYLIGQLERELREVRASHQQQEREIQQLKAQLQALHRRQFKGRTTAAAAPPAAGAADGKKKRGPPFGHPPWQRPQPRHIDQVVPVAAPRCCPHCQRAGLKPVPELHEHVQEDIVLQPRTVATRYVHRQSYCPSCGRNVRQAGPGELLGSYIGPAAKATAVYLRYELNVPERKISRFFADFFGLNFVPASAYNFERQAVRRGRPLYEDLRQKIRCLPVAHADETSWRHDGQNHWLWYFGDDDLALFHLDAHRSGQVARDVLGTRFAGVLVADAYAAYHGVHPKAWQSCLAHIKTKAKELQQEIALLKGRAKDPAALRFCQNIQGWVHDACEAHRRLAQGRWRAQAATRKGAGLRRRLRALCRRSLRHPRAEAFRQRLLGDELQHFFTCFRHPKVPPTNNQAERSLRPAVIGRKVILCTRSEHGRENHSVLRSLFETARRQGHQPHQFFLQLFTTTTAVAQAALYRKPLKAKSRPSPTERKKPP